MIKYASARVSFFRLKTVSILTPINLNFLMKQPLDFAVALSKTKDFNETKYFFYIYIMVKIAISLRK